VQWLQSEYATLNPLILRKELQRARWPQSLLVALEFSRLGNHDPELSAFAEYVATGFARAQPAQRFFFDTEQPGSRAAIRNLGRNLAPYARWGYVGQERPIVDPISKRTVGRYDAVTRRRILKELAQRRESFSIADYLSAVDHGISRQQALKDLAACDEITSRGRGRGAVWQRKTMASGNVPAP
jgi:hypothetical protein